MKHLKSKNIKFENITRPSKKDYKNNIPLKSLDDCVINPKQETKTVSNEIDDFIEKFIEE